MICSRAVTFFNGSLLDSFQFGHISLIPEESWKGRKGYNSTEWPRCRLMSTKYLVLDLLTMPLPMEHSTSLTFTWYDDALLTWAELPAHQDLSYSFLIRKRYTYSFLLPVFSRGNTNGPIILTNSFPYHPFVSLSLALLTCIYFNVTIHIFPIKSMSLCMPWHK